MESVLANEVILNIGMLPLKSVLIISPNAVTFFEFTFFGIISKLVILGGKLTTNCENLTIKL